MIKFDLKKLMIINLLIYPLTKMNTMSTRLCKRQCDAV